jgi:hypothetical protein
MCDGGVMREKGLKIIIGGVIGDYLYFFCEKCESRVKIKFLGHDGVTPKFESTCKCGETHAFKAIISDIPAVRKAETGKKTDAGTHIQGTGEA